MPNVPRYRLFSGIKKRNSFQAAVCQYAERDAIGLITPLLLGYSVVTCLPAVHKRDDLRLFACFLISPRLNGAFCFGADDEARTRYLNLGKVALYRVSYIRECKIDYTQQLCTCQDFFEKNVTIYLFTTMHFFVII